MTIQDSHGHYFKLIKVTIFKPFKKLAKYIQNEKGSLIVNISDHSGEFENQEFTCYYFKKGIDHKFYAPKTLQQNDVVKKE